MSESDENIPQSGTLASTTKSGLLTNLINWMYMPEGYLPFVPRVAALAWLCMMPLFWLWGAKGGKGPYNVPAWRIGNQLIEWPIPPDGVTNLIFITAALCCFWIIFTGTRRKAPLVFIALVEIFFGFRDYLAVHISYTVLLLCIILSLLFAHKDGGRSCARRLVQLSLFFVYFYSVVGKLLYPDFMQGYSLWAIFKDGWPMRTFLGDWLKANPFPFEFYTFFAWMVVIVEGYIMIALFVPKTRRSSLIIGFIFHLGIFVFLNDSVGLFSLVVFATYLAYAEPGVDFPVLEKWMTDFEEITHTFTTQVLTNLFPTVLKDMQLLAAKFGGHGNQTSSASRTGSGLETALASTFVLLMLCVPARVYFWPGRPVSSLNFFDRSPWVFATFLIRQKTQSVAIAYQSADGNWHDYPVQGRMADPANDNDLLAMSHYIFAQTPAAQKLKIEVGININDHWLQTKTFTAGRDAQSHPTLVVRDEPWKIGSALPAGNQAKASQ